MARAYEQIIERFVAWATGEEAIRAAAVIGSRARTDHPADEWADLGIVIWSTDPAPYLVSRAWMDLFSRLARELSARLGLPYPVGAETRAMELVREYESTRPLESRAHAGATLESAPQAPDRRSRSSSRSRSSEMPK